MEHTRIAVAEDDPVTRKNYIQRFAFFKEIEIVALARSGKDLLRKLERLSINAVPHVVLMDIEMPGLSGIETAALVKDEFPDTEIMMLTVFQDDEKIFRSIQAGASGYLLKDCSTEELVQAIAELRDGGAPLSKSIARKVLQFTKEKTSVAPKDFPRLEPGASPFELTPRELEILQQIVHDEKEFAIARNLGISRDTVHTHIKNIYKKLQVHSRGAVVKAALMNRLVDDSHAESDE